MFFFLDLPGQMFVNLRQMQRDVSKVSSNTDLLAELEKIASDKGFVISDNEGSGNCMFYALSEQLNFVKGIKISHGELRQSIVQYLRKNPKLVSLVYFCHAYSKCGPKLDIQFCVQVFVEFYVYTPIIPFFLV